MLWAILFVDLLGGLFTASELPVLFARLAAACPHERHEAKNMSQTKADISLTVQDDSTKNPKWTAHHASCISIEKGINV